ncbi:hypothetical protein M404DRAFT_17017 [Pisolithus tinctorius Marx 270]|uniref:Uncharacterized protein n=1 Tax=Pisolithus tinctorius Marx 270 TaxID=870435 RepID=A0A0C3NJ97_PISTI|nr:hypothetical protein M404DRAFT_17017 [Pisolithus tinctorius Marx 270]
MDEALPDTCTDEAVAHHVDQSPTLTTTRTESVCVLSHNLVAKTDAIEKVRSVCVNVPAIRRIVPLPEEDRLIVMKRIHGETMEQLWPRLRLWTTIRIAWELRSFVSAHSHFAED